MDVKDGYISVGLNDGRVIFYKAITGAQLMHFHTKHAKVRSIFMDSSSILFTGSDDGKITRYSMLYHPTMVNVICLSSVRD